MLVSVIIPVYNSSQTIIGCIKSVYKQTYPYIEILVINDGSTDNSVIILKNYIEENKCKNIKIINQENKGPSTARNNGIAYAKGDFIAFLDSDDEWYPEKIEKQIKYFNMNNDLVLLGTSYTIGSNKVNKYKTENKITLNKLIYKNYFITSTVLCPRWIFDIYKFNAAQKYSEDYLLWLQIATLKKKCVVLGDILTKMNSKPLFGSAGLSANLWLMEKMELVNLFKIYKERHILIFQYLSATIYSILKYFRRIIISFVNNCKKNISK